MINYLLGVILQVILGVNKMVETYRRTSINISTYKSSRYFFMRAKFYVNSKTVQANTTAVNVELLPVVSSSDENKEFWKYTPAGKLELSICNPTASEFLEVGKEYYLDFTKA